MTIRGVHRNTLPRRTKGGTDAFSEVPGGRAARLGRLWRPRYRRKGIGASVE
jgi:hypothetical protein